MPPSDPDPLRDGPDTCGVDPVPLACPACWTLMHYALNTDRYVCPECGPALTAEAVWTLLGGVHGPR